MQITKKNCIISPWKRSQTAYCECFQRVFTENIENSTKITLFFPLSPQDKRLVINRVVRTEIFIANRHIWAKHENGVVSAAARGAVSIHITSSSGLSTFTGIMKLSNTAGYLWIIRRIAYILFPKHLSAWKVKVVRRTKNCSSFFLVLTRYWSLEFTCGSLETSFSLPSVKIFTRHWIFHDAAYRHGW